MRRIPVVSAAVVAFVLGAAPVQAQNARGTVHDTTGRAIRGATIRASNPDASPSEFTSTTNDRGQWAMIGLRSGTWRFLAEAPGFAPVAADVPVRASGAPPIAFTLERDPSTLPGALDRNVIRDLDAALALREAGRQEDALEAYTRIRNRNPKLTRVNLVIAELCRTLAAEEDEPAARRALLQRAEEVYAGLLALEAGHPEAQAGIDAVRRELASTNP